MTPRSFVAVTTVLALATVASCGSPHVSGAAGSRTTSTAAITTAAPVDSTPTSSIDPTTSSEAGAPITVRPRSATSLPRATTTPRNPAIIAPSTTRPPATAAPRSVGDAGLVGAAGKVVVLDAGHNGANGQHIAEINRLVDIGNGRKACNTTGTASNDGYAEAAFTWDVTSRVASLLSAAGAKVVLTRSSNDGWGPCIDQRAAVANQAHADATVSIHADGAGATSRGFHVIYPLALPGINDRIVEPSTRLAQALRASFEPISGLPVSNYVGRDGLIARNDLGGLNLAKVPAVFIECGNMRNALDVAVMKSPGGRQRIAVGIAVGIAAYLGGS